MALFDALKRAYLDEINAMHQARVKGNEHKEAIHKGKALEVMDRLAFISEDEEEKEEEG